MRRIFRIAILTLSFLLIGCVSQRDNPITEFRELMLQGDRLVLEDRFDEALSSYDRAGVKANTIRWIEGVVQSKRYAAKAHLAKGEVTLALEILRDSSELCLSDVECLQYEFPITETLLIDTILKNSGVLGKSPDEIGRRVENLEFMSANFIEHEVIISNLKECAEVLRDHSFPEKAVQVTRIAERLSKKSAS